ncbi:MAG: AbrB/MazE/SpoVT family DNA-binding domain-containing protein [Janibacter sp.]|nr:AbrB/MazE/SpoVT family DNA-binding domain-containing protein [Janibacter sp.]
MRTTIDGAGRIVVPKALRDAMRVQAGQQVDIVFTDGRLEIEVAPTEARVVSDDEGVRIVPEEPLPPLTDEVVRAALEHTRR